MRLLPVAVLAVLLAGCTSPTDDKDDDPLFGLCPQWAQGHGGTTSGIDLQGSQALSRELGPAEATYLDRPLDLFRVRIDEVAVNGTLELRATSADGARLTLRDYRLGETQMVPVVDVDPTLVGRDIDVFLSPVLDDAPAARTPAALNWTLDGSSAKVAYSVTYHYKVCGA